MNPSSPDMTALHLTRAINAPRAAVFQAWTDPQLLAQWWWPPRFQTQFEIDLQVGGQWRFHTIDLPDLGVLAVHGVFHEIDAPKRLVYTWTWESSPEEGETLVVVEFHERGEQTEVQVTQERLVNETIRDNHLQGWLSCIERLEQFSMTGSIARQ